MCLITALVAAISLFGTAQFFKTGLQASYCNSQVMPNVKLGSVVCFQICSMFTEIRCGEGKTNAHSPLPGEWMLPLHSKPECTQCLSCKPQPQSGIRGHLSKLVLFCSAEIGKCCHNKNQEFSLTTIHSSQYLVYNINKMYVQYEYNKQLQSVNKIKYQNIPTFCTKRINPVTVY